MLFQDAKNECQSVDLKKPKPFWKRYLRIRQKEYLIKEG